MPKNLKVIDVKPQNEAVIDVLPKNQRVLDILPKNEAIIDFKPQNESVIDVISKNMSINPQTLTRSYQVAHTVGVVMLSVPLITYSSAGTETQWSEGGGGVISI